jgi:WD40 repeat protein
VRELGRGGYGVVFLAWDPVLRRNVALKVPRPEALLTPGSRQRFLREARAAAVLQHPNLVPVYETGELGLVTYLASRYCEGPTLAAWLKQRSDPVPWRTAARLVEILAQAVSHAHGLGILHRDLKPSNVLLEGRSRSPEDAEAGPAGDLPFLPQITDFGLAKLTGEEETATLSGALVGTPRYMAPEQAECRGRAIGPATDVYALGVILYEVLLGRPPFIGETHLATLQQVTEAEPVSPQQLRSEVPADLEAICLKCLEKDPAQRYASAAALAEDLHRLLAGEPTRARPVGRLRRVGKWARRRPAAAALVIVSTLAVAGLLLGTIFYSLEMEQRNVELQKLNANLDDKTREATRERNQALTQAELLRRKRYADQVHRVDQERGEGLWVQAVERLDGLRPEPGQTDLRGFEWYYLKGLCHPFHAVWRGHQSSVYAVAVSGDGRTVASGGRGGTIRLWDTATGQTRAVFTGHAREVDILAISPDDQTLASVSREDRTIRFWDLTTGKERTRLTLGFEVEAFRFTPGGKQFAVGSAEGVRFWDTATLKPAPGFLKQPTKVVDLAITPDRRTLATGHADGTVRLWDLPSGSERQVLRGGHDGAIRCLALAPDGRTLASGGWWDNKVNLWDVATGKLQTTLRGHRGSVWSVAFAPNGRTLASSTIPAAKGLPPGVGEIKLWDVATGERLPCAFERLAGDTRALAFLPPGRLLVLGCEDNTVKLLDTAPGPRAQDLPGHAPAETWALAFAPNGKTLASAGDDHLVRLWDSDTGLPRAVLKGHGTLVSAVVFSPDGRTVAAADYDDRVKLWDADTGRLKRTLKDAKGALRCVAFAPDGRTVAAGGREKTVRLWDVATGRALACLTGDGRSVRGVAFSPDGRVLASASEGGKVRLWDTATWQLRGLLDDVDSVLCVAFAPDGKTLACGNKVGLVRLWDVAAGKESAVLKGHVKQIYALAFAPDGRTLATAGDDRTVRLWQAATGEELLVLKGHATRVNAVAFSPDGRTLASGSHDGAVKLWRAPTRE